MRKKEAPKYTRAQEFRRKQTALSELQRLEEQSLKANLERQNTFMNLAFAKGIQAVLRGESSLPDLFNTGKIGDFRFMYEGR